MDLTTTADLRGPAASEYDALADLFLSEDAVAPAPTLPIAPKAASPALQTPAAPRPSAAMTIEGVIAGHLPVLASAWVTQYARHVADAEHQPVALLRFAAGNAWLDLVMPSGSRVPQDAAASPDESLEDILSRTASRCRHWLIRVDAPSEPDLLTLGGLARLTLLTGADDVAVLASYTSIKGLAQANQDGPAETPLRLVIMGAHQEKAADAEAKLRRAAVSFLDKELEPAIRIGKIGASLSVQLFRGPRSLELSEILPLLQSAKASPVAPAAAPAPLQRPAPRAAQAAPQPTAEPIQAAPAQPASPLPGLTPLPHTCPYAKGVQLAAATDGRLHLIVQTVSSGTTVGEAAKRLLTAAAWSADHTTLLAAACPQLRTGSLDPVLHIVTNDAKEARYLLDTGMRIHLAVKAEFDGRSVWAYTDLN